VIGSALVTLPRDARNGDIAQHFDQGLSYGGFLQHTIASAGYTFWLIFACLLFVALVYSRHDPARLALGLAGITIVVAYLLLVARSVNSEDRFLCPGAAMESFQVRTRLAAGGGSQVRTRLGGRVRLRPLRILRVAPSTWQLQIDGKRDRLSEARRYA
jgi:hypothetical protein